MKTADQIYSKLDPRTPISSAPFIITNSGSYYLTTNLTVNVNYAATAIQIAANNVTLDLNGFALTSTVNPAGGAGIYLGAAVAVTNITIVNGIISGSVTNNGSSFGGAGFGYGIFGWSPVGYSVRVKDVTISGCRYDGILLVESTVESCTVKTVGDTGIFATSVINSTALNCGNIAINATIANGCYTAAGANNITYKYNMP
jgi:hypothetical protein